MATRTAKRKVSRKTGRLASLSRRFEPRWLSACALWLVLMALVSQFSGTFWLGSVLHELRFHLCLLAMLFATLAVWHRAWPALATCALLAILWGSSYVALGRSTRPTPPSGPTLRVLGAHLAEGSLSSADLLTYLVSNKIDVAVLSAPTLQGLGGFAGDSLRNYRSLHGTTRDAPWLLLGRKELGVRTSEKRGPTARVRVGACELGIEPLNVPSVFSATERKERAAVAHELSSRSKGPRSLWLGYLGSSPQAADLAGLLKRQEVRDGRIGYGRLSSAPSALGPLGLPLSHLLLRGWLRVTALSIEAPLARGAHGTLRATLELTEPVCRARVP